MIFPDGLFPVGFWHYLLGGIIIGISVLVMYLPSGSIPGASRIISAVASFCTGLADKNFRKHRLQFGGGIVLGAFVYTLLFGDFWQTQVHWARLLIGGFFVGLGANIGRGCTSGHGICGLASLSKSSFIFVITFMVVAIATALLVGVIL
jgi:hypothetical protein